MSDPSAWSNSIRAMGDTFNKLQCLNYQLHFVKELGKDPIRRDHFIFPTKNPSAQFTHFIDAALWLVSIIKCDGASFDIDQYDDPNTIVQRLVIELQKIGCDSNFSSTKLMLGYGETVTAVLDYLTDKALEQKGFLFERPIYKTGEDKDDCESDVDDEVVDEVGMDEIIVSDNEEECWDDSSAEEEKQQHNDFHDAKIIKSTIDPIEWRAELERVSSRLIGELDLTFGMNLIFVVGVFRDSY